MKTGVLDHGYVELIESWGSDERIIEAARMSTAKGFQGWGTTETPGDEKLLRYLWENKHHTPFEMAGLTIEVQAPIFVFREWHRHRTQSYNEMSARYVQMPDVHWNPTVERIKLGGGKNKQAQGVAPLASAVELDHWISRGQELQDLIYQHYERGLSLGVPKEVARYNTPVSRYSRMRASANLRNWLAFLTLRQASGAQWEIRQYANAVGSIVAASFPRTWHLFGASSPRAGEPQ